MSLNDGKVHPTSCNCDIEKDNPFKIFMGYDSCEDIAYEVESIDFSFTTFFTPHLENYEGWAVFVDCDFLYLVDIKELRDLTDDKYAIMCVQHEYTPKETTKIDGAVQTVYPRKNWSSMVLYNCRHPKNKVLTPEVVNAQTDAFLHRFQWLEDEEIKSIPFTWNFLEGHNQVVENDPETFPKAIHYTRGGSWFEAWKGCEFADLWLNEMEKYVQEMNNEIRNQIELVGADRLPPRSLFLPHFSLFSSSKEKAADFAPDLDRKTSKSFFLFLKAKKEQYRTHPLPTMFKPANVSFFLIFLVLYSQTHGGHLLLSDINQSTSPDLISDRVIHHHHQSHTFTPYLTIKNASSAEDSTFEQTYKFLPCTTTVIGNLSLPNILVFSLEGSGDPCFKLWLTSALHHVALWLSGWQLLPGLSLGPVRAPSPAHVGPPHLGSFTLSESQSIGQ
ncbi:hypothetical protein ACFX15_039334 [Malus domestica]